MGPYQITKSILTRIDTSYHEQCCPRRWTAGNTYTLDIRLAFCSMLLSKTVQATISLTRAAGGCSISPKLTFRATVPSDSGAFALLSWKGRYLPQINVDDLLWEVKKLFLEGKASPTDLDTDGGNLLHVSSLGLHHHHKTDREGEIYCGLRMNHFYPQPQPFLSPFPYSYFLQFHKILQYRQKADGLLRSWFNTERLSILRV